MKRNAENVGMYINTVPSKLSIDSAANAILKILGSKQDQETIQKALEIFGGCVEANPVSVSGCTISMGEKNT